VLVGRNIDKQPLPADLLGSLGLVSWLNSQYFFRCKGKGTKFYCSRDCQSKFSLVTKQQKKVSLLSLSFTLYLLSQNWIGQNIAWSID
jgi:hypothetical protein